MSNLKVFHYDNLTNLANREALLAQCEESSQKALALININAFGEINDLYGQKFGDKVLQAVASFLHYNLDPDRYTLYKMPGDEFAISTQTDKEQFYAMLMKLIFRLDSYKFSIDGHIIYVSVTGGLSCAAGTAVLEDAKRALKWAKESKKPIAYAYETPLKKSSVGTHLEMLEHLKYALEYDKVYPVFQPICCNQSCKTLKYEALMRVKDRDGKIMYPEDFLEFSKKARIYPELTKRIIRKSLNTFAEREECISINLSIEDIISPDVSSYLFDEIDAFCTPERIVIEITETEGIDNYDIVKAFVQQLKKRKVRVALDDFGSGYSNFRHLLDLNADIIKIDGSIIERITQDTKSKILTKTIVGMAKEMKIRVIAEFVSSQEILDTLISLGVDESQGYLLGKPQMTL